MTVFKSVLLLFPICLICYVFFSPPPLPSSYLFIVAKLQHAEILGSGIQPSPQAVIQAAAVTMLYS